MAKQQLAVAVVKMHAVASAIAKEGAVGTVTLFHPAVIAVGKVAVFPDVHKVVPVDVALAVVGTDAGAGADGAVDEDRADGDACLAGEEVVAHVGFVASQKSLAAVAGKDAPLLTGSLDEVECAPEFFCCQLHVGVVSSPAHGEDGEDAPVGDALLDEVLLDGGELGVVAAIDAGDDVEDQRTGFHQHVDGFVNH